MMRGIKILYCCSLAALIAAGLFFVHVNRQAKIVGIIENLKDKTIVFYSSNSKRSYVGYQNNIMDAMDMLCIEGVSHLRTDGFQSIHYRIESGDADPYTQSGLYLHKNIKNGSGYVLIDISRGQTRHGEKYGIDGKTYCPITIRLSKRSSCYDNSILFAGRVKSYMDEKYKTLPVEIITMDGQQDYNQSLGYMAMLVEFGDSGNSYDEARESLKLFCQSIIQVNRAQR